MKSITFKIDFYETFPTKPYTLKVDGELAIEDVNQLEDIVKEIKKYLRLRFKEPLK